jgi:hypothetical protein
MRCWGFGERKRTRKERGKKARRARAFVGVERDYPKDAEHPRISYHFFLG